MRSPCLLCGEKDRSYSEKVRRWAVSWARGRGDLRVAAHRCSPELMERRGGFMGTAESTGPGGRLGTQVSSVGGGCSWWCHSQGWNLEEEVWPGPRGEALHWECVPVP